MINGLSEAQALAAKYGGQCLSRTYISSTKKLRWQCAENHQFTMSLTTVKRGHWCRKCSHKRTADKLRGTLAEMQEIARARGGDCLSTEYINSATKLTWRCAEGHIWQTTPAKVKSGTWCRECAGVAPGTIEEMHRIAQERGGRCLSRRYLGRRKKLWWKCGYGHKKWAAEPGNIRMGSWCPECSKGLGERICRLYFETLFSTSFPSAWPDWLRNKRGSRLQLDGYSEKLGLAFEHDGHQHHRFIKHFHGNKATFRRRMSDDRLKAKICRERGVALIRIKAIPTLTRIDDIKSEIARQCNAIGYPLPRDFNDVNVDLKSAYAPDKKLERYREIVALRGGRVLSEIYLGNQVELLHVCEAGHQFLRTPDSVKQGRWCQHCAGTLPITIEDMRALAQERGGRCLSEEYINSTTPLRWECKKHHQWSAPPSRIRNGAWCRRCFQIENGKRRRLTIEDMHELAAARGGKCLSKTYRRNSDKLWWQCGAGHPPWRATASNVRHGQWCRQCGLERREATRRKIGGWPDVREKKIQWRPFDDARVFVVALGLKSQSEWRRWAAGRDKSRPARPPDIPSSPERVYQGQGWKSMGDWLGTGAVAPQKAKYRNFAVAREWARSLGLKGESEWRDYLRGAMTELPNRPHDIPASPNQVYRQTGWAGWGDWLGTGNRFTHAIKQRSFARARQFVRSLGLKSRRDWERYCKGELENLGRKPDDIPKSPWAVYRDRGWKDLKDWLGAA